MTTALDAAAADTTTDDPLTAKLNTAAVYALATSDEPPVLDLTAAAAEIQELGRIRWAGWLAPLERRPADRRDGVPMPTSGKLKTREMPLALLWQRETSHGGTVVNGAVEVGGITYADIRPRPDRDDHPWIWGSGYINLNDTEGVRLAARLDDGMSRWVSVRLDYDEDYEPPADAADTETPDSVPKRRSPTDDPDAWRLMNVTVEPQPAFDAAEIWLLEDLDDVLGDDDRDDDRGDEDSGEDREQGPVSEEEGPRVAEDPERQTVVVAVRSEGARTDVPGQPMPDAVSRGPASALPPQMATVAGGAEVTAMSETTSTSMAADYQPPATPSEPASGGSGSDVSTGRDAGDHGDGPDLVAVVTGDMSLPIAERETKWDGPGAAKRLVDWAGGRFSLDPGKMAKVFLYRDSTMSPKMVTAWKFPIADIFDGRVKIVPRAVFTAAAVLRGSMGGTKIPRADQQAMRGKLNTLYGRIRKQFDDPKIRSPFEAVVLDMHAAAMLDGDTAGGPKPPPWRRSSERRRERRSLPKLTASATSWAAQVAARVPEEPPREWFTDPKLTKPSKIRVSDEGRIFGHVAGWATEHAAFPGVKPPRNRDRTYSKFHRHPVRCADGSVVKTGPLATGGHSSTEPTMAMETVQAHYDDPRYVVGDVTCGEDEHGIWVSGALRPGISPFQVLLADRYSFSGDWRYGELLAACSVSVPGFHLDAGDEVTALTAAASDAGVVNLPVVAEAAPMVVNDTAGSAVVLIAAGVIVEDDPEQDPAANVSASADDNYAADLDALGHWVSEELTAIRSEFGMTATTTAVGADLAQLHDVMSAKFAVLRTEFGIEDATPSTPDSEGAVHETTAGTSGPDAKPNAGGPDGEPGEQEQGTDEAPAADPDGTTTDGEPTATPAVQAGATMTLESFAQWITDQVTSILQAPRTATAADERAALAASIHEVDERAALAASIHEVDERAALAASIHTEVA